MIDQQSTEKLDRRQANFTAAHGDDFWVGLFIVAITIDIIWWWS